MKKKIFAVASAATLALSMGLVTACGDTPDPILQFGEANASIGFTSEVKEVADAVAAQQFSGMSGNLAAELTQTEGALLPFASLAAEAETVVNFTTFEADGTAAVTITPIGTEVKPTSMFYYGYLREGLNAFFAQTEAPIEDVASFPLNYLPLGSFLPETMAPVLGTVGEALGQVNLSPAVAMASAFEAVTVESTTEGQTVTLDFNLLIYNALTYLNRALDTLQNTSTVGDLLKTKFVAKVVDGVFYGVQPDEFYQSFVTLLATSMYEQGATPLVPSDDPILIIEEQIKSTIPAPTERATSMYLYLAELAYSKALATTMKQSGVTGIGETLGDTKLSALTGGSINLTQMAASAKQAINSIVQATQTSFTVTIPQATATLSGLKLSFGISDENVLTECAFSAAAAVSGALPVEEGGEAQDFAINGSVEFEWELLAQTATLTDINACSVLVGMETVLSDGIYYTEEMYAIDGESNSFSLDDTSLTNESFYNQRLVVGIIVESGEVVGLGIYDATTHEAVAYQTVTEVSNTPVDFGAEFTDTFNVVGAQTYAVMTKYQVIMDDFGSEYYLTWSVDSVMRTPGYNVGHANVYGEKYILLPVEEYPIYLPVEDILNPPAIV